VRNASDRKGDKGPRRGHLMSLDPQAVRAFEHAGWQQAASGYGATFARATCGFVDDLLDAAQVGAGMQVLDLACGPGLVAGTSRLRGALPTGLHFAAAMIGLARAAHAEDLLRVLDTAGFAQIEAHKVNREWRFAAAGDLIEGFRQGTVRTAALIGVQPASALPAIAAAIARGIAA
jgi:hypothetical protein